MEHRIEQTIEVFHDGDCPVCRLEIRFYERIDRSNRIRWTDVIALGENELPEGKQREELLGKFHVRDLMSEANDRWYVGVDAFARIWRELPGFRWIAWLFLVPGIRQLAQLAYLGFLRWQTRHRARRETAGHRVG